MPDVDPFSVSAPAPNYWRAVTDFESATRATGELLAQANRVRFGTKHRFGASSVTVVAYCRLLARTHEAAVTAGLRAQALRAQLPHVRASTPPETVEAMRQLAERQQIATAEAERRIARTEWQIIDDGAAITLVVNAELHASYQAFFFLVRAFHDRVYSVLLELLGNESGPRGSMSRALTEQGQRSPVGRLLAARCPGYAAWFRTFKKMRDDFKFGVPTGTAGPELNPGVTIVRLDDATGGSELDCSRAYRLGDAAEALDRSSQIVRVAGALVEERGAQDDDPAPHESTP